jgi:hypothetical protein
VKSEIATIKSEEVIGKEKFILSFGISLESPQGISSVAVNCEGKT